MARVFRVHSATRRRTLLLAIIVLLLQQMALGAYSCKLPPGAMASMPAMAPTPGIDRPMPRQADYTLCVNHCMPDRAVNSDVQPPSAPLAVLAMLLPPAIPSATATALAQAPPRRSHPPPDPPAIRLFCSLLL